MNTTPKQNTLGKAEKLKSRKQIDALFASGTGFTAYPVKVVYKVEKLDSTTSAASSAGIQIGVTASSRNFKHAVDRNFIKRLLREAYRHQKHELLQLVQSKGLQLSMFFIYLDKTLPQFEMLDDKMRYCLKRMRKILEATHEKLL